MINFILCLFRVIFLFLMCYRVEKYKSLRMYIYLLLFGCLDSFFGNDTYDITASVFLTVISISLIYCIKRPVSHSIIIVVMGALFVGYFTGLHYKTLASSNGASVEFYGVDLSGILFMKVIFTVAFLFFLIWLGILTLVLRKCKSTVFLCFVECIVMLSDLPKLALIKIPVVMVCVCTLMFNLITGRYLVNQLEDRSYEN